MVCSATSSSGDAMRERIPARISVGTGAKPDETKSDETKPDEPSDASRDLRAVGFDASTGRDSAGEDIGTTHFRWVGFEP